MGDVFHAQAKPPDYNKLDLTLIERHPSSKAERHHLNSAERHP